MTGLEVGPSKLVAMRAQADRKARENALADSIAALPVGEVVTAIVVGHATAPSNRNDGAEHCFGLFIVGDDAIL